MRGEDVVYNIRESVDLDKMSNETRVIMLLQDIRRELKQLNATLKTTGFLAYHKPEGENEKG